MQDRFAPPLCYAGNIRQLVADAGCQHQTCPDLHLAASEPDSESASVVPRSRYLAFDKLDRGIGKNEAAGIAQNIERRSAILSEKAMARRSEPVARQPRIDNKHSSAGTRQLHRGRKTGVAPTNYDRVKMHI